MPLNTAVFLSGSGRTLDNLLKHQATGLDIAIKQVIASRPDVRGCEIAQNAALPLQVLSFKDRIQDSEQAFALCRQAGVELVILAGFLKRLLIPTDFQGRVINIHPSLLPAYGGQGMYGAHVHQAVVAAGEAESGCTVHLVDEQYDHGRVLAQQKVALSPSDSPQEVADKVFAAECRLYPAIIGKFASGDWPLPANDQDLGPLDGS